MIQLNRRGCMPLFVLLLALTFGCTSSQSTCGSDVSTPADAQADVPDVPFYQPSNCPPANNPLVGSCLEQAFQICRVESDSIFGWQPYLKSACIAPNDFVCEDSTNKPIADNCSALDTPNTYLCRKLVIDANPAQTQAQLKKLCEKVVLDNTGSTTTFWCKSGEESDGEDCHRIVSDLTGVAGVYNPKESDPCVKFIFEPITDRSYRLLYIFKTATDTCGSTKEFEITTIRREPKDGAPTTEVQCPDGTSFTVTDKQAEEFKRCLGLDCQANIKP